MKIYDAVVVGAGPAGITAALYLLRSGCSVALVEQMTSGGQVLRTESIENYPGFPKGIKGWELADAFSAHLDNLSIDKFSGEVSALSSASGLHTLTVGKEALTGRTVILCTGAQHKALGLPEEKKLIGKGVSYCAVCDGNFFRGQDVAVIGGGNTALEETLYLAKLVRRVYLIHRRDSFRAAKVYCDRIASLGDKVQIIYDSVVDALHGEKELEGITVRNLKSTEKSYLSVNGVFIFIGNAPGSAFLPDTIQKNSQGFIITDSEMRTSVQGIFAAGDVREKLCRQVVTAVGDGATAAQAAFVYLEQLHV